MKKYQIFVMLFFVTTLIATGQEKVEKDAVFTKSIEEGQFIYEDFCMNCHLPNGKGVEKTFPPLAKSDYLMNNRSLSIKAIKFGQKGEIIVNGEKYNNVMTPLGLSDQEIADVMNYITTSWGNTNKKMVTKTEVSAIKQ